MMFLIEYDRHLGKIINMKSFSEFERSEADRLRLRTELKLRRDGVCHEVVLLEASNEEALQRTHSRYFSNAIQLADLKMSESNFDF